MHTVKIYQLNHLSQKQFQRLESAQMEAAQVWNCWMQDHTAVHLSHEHCSGRDELQRVIKGCFALHSQSVQMVVHTCLADVDIMRPWHRSFPQMKMRHPYTAKRFYPVSWPAQAVSKQRGRAVLPMGRGRPSLVLPLELAETSRCTTLVWNNGFELHVCTEKPQAEHAPAGSLQLIDKKSTPNFGENSVIH